MKQSKLANWHTVTVFFPDWVFIYEVNEFLTMLNSLTHKLFLQSGTKDTCCWDYLQSICFIQEAKVGLVPVFRFLKAEHNSKKASIDAKTFHHLAIPAKLRMFKWLWHNGWETPEVLPNILLQSMTYEVPIHTYLYGLNAIHSPHCDMQYCKLMWDLF